MTIKKRGLGRGLDVLIKNRVVEPEHGAEIISIDINALSPNIHQPRHHFDQCALEELAASITAQGLIQPILVRPLVNGGKYEIVAGERRWRACKLAGLTSVECIVREMDDYESMAIALIENLQREDLNPIEEARALGQIKDHFDITQEELADKIGKSRPAVTNCLRLLRLPDKVQTMLETNALTAGHARALLGIEDVKAIEFLADMIINKGLNVRATEDLIKKFKRQDLMQKNAKNKNIHLPEYMAGALDALKTQFKVSHSGSEEKGKIVFSYASVEERDKLTDMLNKIATEKAQ